jgi:hypothetical protein
MLRFPSQPACWLAPEGFCLAPVRLDLECSQSNLGLCQGFSMARCLAWNCASSIVVDEHDWVGVQPLNAIAVVI